MSDAVYPFHKGGKERRLWEITRRLASDGFDVTVYTMKWWSGPNRIEMDGVTLCAICGCHPLYKGPRRSIFQALVFGLATLKLLTKSFDVVDVDHMPYFPLFSARMVCSLRRRRLTATWHEVWGADYWESYAGHLGWFGYLMEYAGARMPDQIVSVSEHTSNRLRLMLKVKTPIVTVPLGVDFDRIRDASPSAGADVLYAGRLLGHKGVDVLLRAVAAAATIDPKINGLIVGDGPERANLEALTHTLGLDNRIRFRDFLPGDEIYGVMKASGVFVLPSNREGFGLVVLEANACGLPVVTVRHPDNAAADLIVEGGNGYLADLDVDDLAKVILGTLAARESMDPRAALAESQWSLDWCEVSLRVADSMLATGGRTMTPSRRVGCSKRD